MNRIDRLFAVLTVLESRPYVAAEYLCEKFNISERTLYRDLRALGEIGVPIEFESGKGYRLLQGYFLPPVALTPEEANALVLITSLSARYADGPTRTHVDNALSKIKAVLKHGERVRADRLQGQIRIHPGTDQGNCLPEIQRAVAERLTLEFDYLDNANRRSHRVVEPIGITFYSDQWHLIAWCRKRLAYRDFKLAKMSLVKTLPEPFVKQDHIGLNQYIQSLDP